MRRSQSKIHKIQNPQSDSLSEGNPSLGHVVRADFHLHLVAGKDADEELAHLAADVGHDFLAVFQAHLEAADVEAVASQIIPTDEENDEDDD